MQTHKSVFTHIFILFISFVIFTSAQCQAEDLTTCSGKKYENITIIKVNKDSISINHKNGIAKINFSEFTKEFLDNHSDLKTKIAEEQEATAKKAKEEERQAAEIKKAEQEDIKRKEEEKAKAEQEELKRKNENKEIIAQLFSISGKNSGEPDINACMILFEGSNGAGSGFKAMLGKLPVIITNAHVFLVMNDIKIKDINGNIYEVERIFASKTRDLVILKYKAPPSGISNILSVNKSVSSLPLNSNIEAYGNSLGDGVITVLKGDLMGLGPDKIEINATIVHGNSGGPVLLSKNKEVIGVSTYLRYIEPSLAAKDSRFLGKSFSIGVRRFATRIDNLTADDLQILTTEEIADDQSKLQAIAKVKETIADLANKKDWDELKKYCRKNSNILNETKSLNLNSCYLQRQMQEWRNNISHAFECLDINPDAGALKETISDIFKKNSFTKKTMILPPETRPCMDCAGKGKVERVNYVDNYRRMEAVTCQKCGGTGTKKDSKGGKIEKYEIPKEIENQITAMIKPDTNPFYGFTIGGEMDQAKINEITDGKATVIPNPFGNTVKYRGNKIISSAMETELCFMFGRLVRVEIDTVVTIPDYKKIIFAISKLQNKYSKIKLINLPSRTDGNMGIGIVCEHEVYTALSEFMK